MNLPPSGLTSVASRNTPKRSQMEAIDADTARSRTASSPAPPDATSASVPLKATKLTATWRCSWTAPAITCACCTSETKADDARMVEVMSAGGGGRRCDAVSRCKRDAVGPGRAQPRCRDQQCSRVAEQDLTRGGCRLGSHRRRRPGTTDDEIVAPGVDGEDVMLTGVHADRHGQADEPAVGCRASAADRAAHADGSPAGAGGVALTGEPHEQGVAAELDDVAALSVAVLDHRLEAAADERVELLGAFPAALGQALGQRGEAADVGRHHRPLELLPGHVLRPAAQEIGHIRGERRLQLDCSPIGQLPLPPGSRSWLERG